MAKKIIPVFGKWNWVSENKTKGGDEIFYPVACWEFDSETGFVIGLIALDANLGGNEKCPTGSKVTRLVGPPPIAGRYIRVE